MASKIIIDGYNLIKTSYTFDIRHDDDLQSVRERLTQSLNKYYFFKKIPITVVFDGGKGGQLTENQDRVNNIHIIYSRLGETADEVIKRIVAKNGPSWIVVTSDRDIVNFAERKGAAVIGSTEFEGKLNFSLYAMEKGTEDEEDEDDGIDKPITTKKKGNPRRLSRTERKRKNKLNRL